MLCDESEYFLSLSPPKLTHYLNSLPTQGKLLNLFLEIYKPCQNLLVTVVSISLMQKDCALGLFRCGCIFVYLHPQKPSSLNPFHNLLVIQMFKIQWKLGCIIELCVLFQPVYITSSWNGKSYLLKYVDNIQLYAFVQTGSE